MTTIDEILARSQAAGQFVERKTFTLARAKAVEKMRKFSLRHPDYWVLEIIQAGIAVGGHFVAVDLGAQSRTVAWIGGRHYTERELETLFDALFADRSRVADMPRQQLAVGVNALLQKRPEVIDIETGFSDTQSLRATISDNGATLVVGRTEGSMDGTYITARWPSGQRGAWLFGDGREAYRNEAELVEVGCRYTPVPILLNGHAPFGYRVDKGITLPWYKDTRAFQLTSGVRGALAVPQGEPRGLDIIIHGVHITTLYAPELGLVHDKPLDGVISDGRLRKTADHADIVRDDAFRRLLREIQPFATDLVRDFDPTFQPELSAIEPVAAEVEDASADGPERPVTLPRNLRQAGLRPDLLLSSLVAEGDGGGEPLFWTELDYSANTGGNQLGGAAAVARFPYRLLEITPGEALALAQLTNRPLHRLGTAADVDFVRGALLRRQEQVRVSVPQPGLAPNDASEITLTLVTAGVTPRVGDREQAPVAVVMRDGVCIHCAELEVNLPGLLAVWSLTGPLQGDEMWDALLTTRVIEALPKLLQALPEGPGARAVRVSLVTRLARIHLVRDRQGHLGQALDLGALPQAIRTAPLALTDDGTALSLTALCDLAGSDSVVALETQDERDRLQTLAAMVAPGHVTAPNAHPLAVVTFYKGSWTPGFREDDGATAWLWAGPGLAAASMPQVVEPVQAPLPHLGAGTRGDNALVGVQGALDLVVEQLVAQATQDADPLDAATARVLLLIWAREVPAVDGPLWSTATEPVTMSELRSNEQFRLCGHGTRPDERTVIASLDEALAMQRLVDRPFALLSDDAPEIWHSLGDSNAEGWLARHSVALDGLEGWVGLRFPFDATGGVFLAEGVSWTPVAVGLPCHGLLRPRPGQTALGSEDHEALLSAIDRLYTSLEHESVEGARREAARAYLGMRPKKPAPGSWLEVTEDRLGALFTSSMLAQIVEAPGLPAVVVRAGVGGLEVLHFNRWHAVVSAADDGDAGAQDAVFIEAMRVLNKGKVPLQQLHVRLLR